MLHAASETDSTSIGPPSSSPKAYYVQSPSCDSNDEMDKCSSSNSRSPLDSPSFPRHSMASSSSTAASRISGNRRRWNKHYCNVVAEEEGALDEDYYGDIAYPRQCKCLMLVLAFGMVFAGICLVIWGASRPYKAQVRVKSLRVNNLYYGEGSDRTGVPTKFLSVNCSANIVVYNPARFFGIHVSFRTVNLIYSQITVATGELKKYYQPKKSRRIMQVSLVGQGVPLYGSGMALAASDESGGIPFKLELGIQSRGYLVGKLVKTKHTRHVSCSLVINSEHTKDIIFETNSCKYT
ncbi:hypothetical protein Salat_0845000 [Sesamum alatum]|uniref:Late embryogenesis abundant protein LEA-2 subgroup domain-containing protein n=1 Tax=Sesamum alatum TaxID=300844 RepID=A0AAE2CQJ5_9LAMI|nr:hypothetical protein Salat_0845000 [Sesamum alatum]